MTTISLTPLPPSPGRAAVAVGEHRQELFLEEGGLYYFNPMVGLIAVSGLYEAISGHEKRHQDQLREILDSPSFPASA